jgi:hypothetical protein
MVVAYSNVTSQYLSGGIVENYEEPHFGYVVLENEL